MNPTAPPALRGQPDAPEPRRVWPYALVLAAALLATFATIAPLHLVAPLCAVLVWFVLPGVVMARLLYRGHPGANGAALLLGPAWGFALSSLVLLALWVAGVRHSAMLLILAPLPAILAAVASGVLAGPLEPPRFGRRDLVAVLLLLLVVPLVVGRPYALVGADVPDGRAYRAYFTADFVWSMAVVAEVSKGDVPPRNQFLAGNDLHYYWLPHLLSSVEYRWIGSRLLLHDLLLINGVLLGLAFVAFLYAFARHFATSVTAAALGSLGAVLFNSFEGLERLIAYRRQDNWLELLRDLNVDAVTRWFYSALPVDGLQRVLLYQPQHHAVAYALGLSTLLILARARDVGRPRLMFVVGSLLAAAVLFSAFSAIMLTVTAALYALARMVAARQWRALVPCALAGAVPLASAVAVTFALKYVDDTGSLVQVIVNPMAFTRPFLTIFLSFGPMLILGAAGLALGARQRAPGFLALGILILVSFWFYFFVNLRGHQYVYVGWRAGHLLFVAFAALTAYLLQQAWQARRAVRVSVASLAALLALAAVPTTMIDLYNTQDITNRSYGLGWSWTTVLTHEELEALDWIRQRTPPDAIVQVEPHVREESTWAYVPAFAERRMAGGLPISMVPLAPYEAVSLRVREVYTAADAQASYDGARRLGIEYLLVGPPERAAYPDLEASLDLRPDLFRPMLRNGQLRIYFVEGSQPAGSPTAPRP